MNELLPPAPSSTDTLGALLVVLADPGKYQELLGQLKAQAAVSQEALANAQAAQREADRLHKEADARQALLDEMEANLNRNHQTLDRRQQELDSQKASLDATRKEHARAMDDLAVATKAHEQREIDIDTREGAVAEKERRAEQLLADAEAHKQAAATIRADLERRVAAVKAAAG